MTDSQWKSVDRYITDFLNPADPALEAALAASDAGVRLSRPGTLIIVDNVVRKGAVLDAASTDPNVVGIHALYEARAREPRVRATALQTVGSKGYDGLAFALVVAP